MKFIKSNFSIEELETFRNQEGYIDLEQAGIVLDEASREIRGNSERFKNWVDFNGTKVLVKEETVLEKERNFGVYSELLMVELANQLGIPAAKTDLITYKGKFGVLSYMVLEPEREEMETVYGLIGETETIEEEPEISDYEEVEEKLKSVLQTLDMTEEEIEELLQERRKQKILQLLCCEADGHIENEAFIRYKTEDGRTVARMAPMFDNETSLLLDMEGSVLETLLYNNQEDNIYKEQLETLLEKGRDEIIDAVETNMSIKATVYNLRNLNVDEQKMAEILNGDASLREVAQRIRSKIATVPGKKEFEYEALADNTIKTIIEVGGDEAEDFLAQACDRIDIEKAIQSVEQKIKAPIPQIAKNIVVPFIEMRKRTVNNILCYEEPCAENKQQAHRLYKMLLQKEHSKHKNDFSKQIIAKSIEEGISSNEMANVFKEIQAMEKEMQHLLEEQERE